MYHPRGIFDPFIFTEQELLDLKHTAFRLMKEGKTIMSYAGEGTSASRQFTMPIDEMLLEVVWALKSKLPGKYGHIATRSRNWFF